MKKAFKQVDLINEYIITAPIVVENVNGYDDFKRKLFNNRQLIHKMLISAVISAFKNDDNLDKLEDNCCYFNRIGLFSGLNEEVQLEEEIVVNNYIMDDEIAIFFQDYVSGIKCVISYYGFVLPENEDEDCYESEEETRDEQAYHDQLRQEQQLRL